MWSTYWEPSRILSIICELIFQSNPFLIHMHVIQGESQHEEEQNGHKYTELHE